MISTWCRSLSCCLPVLPSNKMSAASEKFQSAAGKEKVRVVSRTRKNQRLSSPQLCCGIISSLESRRVSFKFHIADEVRFPEFLQFPQPRQCGFG